MKISSSKKGSTDLSITNLLFVVSFFSVKYIIDWVSSTSSDLISSFSSFSSKYSLTSNWSFSVYGISSDNTPSL